MLIALAAVAAVAGGLLHVPEHDDHADPADHDDPEPVFVLHDMPLDLEEIHARLDRIETLLLAQLDAYASDPTY